MQSILTMEIKDILPDLLPEWKNWKKEKAGLMVAMKKLIREYGRCEQCGWCCKNERLTIFSNDVKKLGNRFKPEHIERQVDTHIYTLKLPCPFLSGKRCSAYNLRPEVCTTYPFLFHYPRQITIGIDCPLGKRICDDIQNYCEITGIKISYDDEEKSKLMKSIDQLVNEKGWNSGDGYQSKIVNVPQDMFNDFLIWRKKNRKEEK